MSSWEPVHERLIREAAETGDFDELPGTGKPLPRAGQRDDPLWWVRAWMRRNRIETPEDPKNDDRADRVT